MEKLDNPLEIPLRITKQFQSELRPFNALAENLLDLPGMKDAFQRVFDSTFPRFTSVNADMLVRMALRVSAGLSPVPVRKIDIGEFQGSLSRLLGRTLSSGEIEKSLEE